MEDEGLNKERKKGPFRNFKRKERFVWDRRREFMGENPFGKQLEFEKEVK